jgi:hypothetical protein
LQHGFIIIILITILIYLQPYLPLLSPTSIHLLLHIRHGLASPMEPIILLSTIPHHIAFFQNPILNIPFILPKYD